MSDTNSAKPTPATKPAQEWPALVESGAGLSETERAPTGPMTAPAERAAKPRFTLAETKANLRSGASRVKAEVKKNPILFVGLGALALGGVVALLGRKALFRAAAPMLVKAAARHPVKTARLAARHPRTTYGLVALGLEPTVDAGMRTLRSLPQKVRALEPAVTSSLEAVREFPQIVREKVARRR